MLVHAGIADSGMWDPQWEDRAGRFRVVCYDQRGFGRSPIEAGPYSHGADLVAVLDALGIGDRLGELRGPALVLVGSEDVSDFHAIADRLAAAIPGTERATVAGAAHLPSAERPEAFAAAVEPFLDRVAR